MLVETMKQNLSCSFAVEAGAIPKAGTCRLMQNLVMKDGASFAVRIDGAQAGTAAANGKPLEKDGMLWRIEANDVPTSLAVEVKAGSMLKGTAGTDEIKGTSARDVF